MRNQHWDYGWIGLVIVIFMMGRCSSLLTPPSKQQQQQQQGRQGVWWKYKEQLLSSSTNKKKNLDVITFEEETNMTMIHEYFMRMALEQASIAANVYDEVPIGAVLVMPTEDDKNRTFTILATGHNQVETLQDASAHAEMMVLREASSLVLQNWRLYNTTLYCTCEPCVMCCAAIQAFRLSSVVYGAPDKRLGAITTHIPLLDIATHPYHTTLTATGGILEQQCSQILIDFFRQKRKQKLKKSPPTPTPTPEDTNTSTSYHRLIPLWKPIRNILTKWRKKD